MRIEPFRRPPMDETIRRYGNLVTPPGEHYQYSNLGYGVIDYVIARTSGKSYKDFMREEVFLPLGMTHASIDVGPGLKEYEAVRYGPDGLPIAFYDFDHPGAFGRVLQCARSGPLRHVPHRRQAARPEGDSQRRFAPADAIADLRQDGRRTIRRRLGHRRRRARGYRRISHSGGMGGVTTMLTLLPKERLVVVVLCNSRTPLPMMITNRIIATVLPEPEKKSDSAAEAADKTAAVAADAAKGAGKDMEKSADKDAAEGDERKAPMRDLQSLAGTWTGQVHTYNGDPRLTLTVKDSGDVHVQLGHQLVTLLAGAKFDDGWLRGRFAGDIGTEDANRTKYHLVLEVKQRGDKLCGSLVAQSVEAVRTGNALTQWVELKRE